MQTAATAAAPRTPWNDAILPHLQLTPTAKPTNLRSRLRKLGLLPRGARSCSQL
jgi:hypothetical protein